MAYRVFTIPLLYQDQSITELNQFLATHQVLEVDRQFHAHESQAFWFFCVSYVPTKSSGGSSNRIGYGKIDYKEVLSEEDFSAFVKLRDLRKTVAEEESVPVFAIFTNEQLAELVRRRVKSKKEMREIEDIGAKKVENYGDRFLNELRSLEQNGKTKPESKDQKKLFSDS